MLFRPVVIAGEVIQVLLLKEGKEPNQGCRLP